MLHSSVEKLHAFYAQDRAIFTKLVLKFSRSPAESLLVMATWLWLEDFGFEYIFSIIMVLNDPLIAALADEAVLCFQCLDSTEPPIAFNQIPLTTAFMEKKLSLQLIYEHRYSAITGIKKFLTTICSRIFSDILQRVLPSASSFSFTAPHLPLIIPGFPHQTFGSVSVMPHVVSVDSLLGNNLFRTQSDLWGWSANCTENENDRTIFLTFSRGFPVSEDEVKQLFTEEFGENCVNGIYMSGKKGNSPSRDMNTNGHQQSLYATMILDSVVTVDRILKEIDLFASFRLNSFSPFVVRCTRRRGLQQGISYLSGKWVSKMSKLNSSLSICLMRLLKSYAKLPENSFLDGILFVYEDKDDN